MIFRYLKSKKIVTRLTIIIFLVTVSIKAYGQEINYEVKKNKIIRLEDSTIVEPCLTQKDTVIKKFGMDYYPLSQEHWETNSLYYENLGIEFFYDSDKIIYMISIGAKAGAVFKLDPKNIVLGKTEFRYLKMGLKNTEDFMWTTSNGSMMMKYETDKISFAIARDTLFDSENVKNKSELERMKSSINEIRIKCVKRHPNTKDANSY